MNTYFHAAPIPLQPGATILPGNWGRILNLYRRPGYGDGWLLAREMTFEAIRASEFPDLPSRLSSAFVFENLQDALHHINNTTPSSLLYRVELVEPSAASHRGCMNQVSFPPEEIEALPAFVEKARAFWSAKVIEVPEILTKSALRVIEVVNGPAGGYKP